METATCQVLREVYFVRIPHPSLSILSYFDDHLVLIGNYLYHITDLKLWSSSGRYERLVFRPWYIYFRSKQLVGQTSMNDEELHAVGQSVYSLPCEASKEFCHYFLLHCCSNYPPKESTS